MPLSRSSGHSGAHAAAAVDPRRWWILAAALVVAHLALRAWALYPSFFFTDDYRLLLDAQDWWEGTPDAADSLAGYALRPFDSQFMPGGRLLALLVMLAGPTSWAVAATGTLLLQLAADVTCLWLLCSLFGRRPAVLALLALYLSTAITMPAFMWWAAGLNQLPLQVAFFATLALGVRYLRAPSWRGFVPVALVLLLGLLCYLKALLIAPVLAAVGLGWFARGGPRARIVSTVRRYHHAAILGLALTGAYSVYYLTQVPPAFEGTGTADTASQVANAMLGTALPVGVLGGPWTWFETSPPLVLVGTPVAVVHLAWVLVALLVAGSVLLRRHAWRGWALVAGYAVLLFVLLLLTRGQLFGGFAGLELRYLTDLACVLPLGVGLALLPVLGAEQSSKPRRPAVLLWTPGPRLVATVVAIVVGGGIWSSATYAGFWHRDNASEVWVRNVQSGVAAVGSPQDPVDLADRLVPDRVMPEYTQPDNQVARLVPLVAPDVRFPDVSADLHVVTDDGTVFPAQLDLVARSVARTTESCARLLAPGTTSVRFEPLQVAPSAESDAAGRDAWLRLGYLASQASDVTVVSGEQRTEARLRQGLHALFVRVADPTAEIEIGGLDLGARVCLDDAEIGLPRA